MDLFFRTKVVVKRLNWEIFYRLFQKYCGHFHACNHNFGACELKFAPFVSIFMVTLTEMV